VAYLEHARAGDKRHGKVVAVERSPRSTHGGSERWLPPVVVAAALLLWELLARRGSISPLFFPAPSIIAGTFVRLIVDGTIFPHLMVTLSRIFVGFAVGAIPGLVLGILMGSSRRIRAAIDPIIAALHPVPKISLLPLLMIIFGIGDSSKIAIIAVAVFFPITLNTTAGISQIHPLYFDVAKNCGAKPVKVLQRVIIPGSLPLILTGVRLALNVSFMITIAVEIISAMNGLGSLIWWAWETLRTEELYATLLVVVIFGIGMNFLLQSLVKRLAPWHAEQEYR
jgi:ABC-type nitrate/sulfonate/bicarbonate transport system permease component